MADAGSAGRGVSTCHAVTCVSPSQPGSLGPVGGILGPTTSPDHLPHLSPSRSGPGFLITALLGLA